MAAAFTRAKMLYTTMKNFLIRHLDPIPQLIENLGALPKAAVLPRPSLLPLQLFKPLQNQNSLKLPLQSLLLRV